MLLYENSRLNNSRLLHTNNKFHINSQLSLVVITIIIYVTTYAVQSLLPVEMQQTFPSATHSGYNIVVYDIKRDGYAYKLVTKHYRI